MTKGKIPTVQDYQACNYEPKAAFVSALRQCEEELAHIESYKMRDLAVHLAMFGNWKEKGWEFVQDYVELAQDLRAIYDKWERRLHEELK